MGASYRCEYRQMMVCTAMVCAAAVVLILQLWSVSSPSTFRPSRLGINIAVSSQEDGSTRKSTTTRTFLSRLLVGDDSGQRREELTALLVPTIVRYSKTWKHLTEAELLMRASTAAGAPQSSALRRVAFLFIVRGEMPHEALWRKFLAGHEDKYSIYVHASPSFRYPRGSIFWGKEIASKPVERLSGSLVDAMRRLLANALLDEEQSNEWFTFVCESTIPLRDLPFVYNYLMSSRVSFVESFRPVDGYLSWDSRPDFSMDKLRKGELWMAVHRRHARMIVGEWSLYYKFLRDCNWMCAPDEQFIQTLLHIKDARGIANRTIMYVDWTHPHTSSPFTYDVDTISLEFLHEIRGLQFDMVGARHDTAAHNASLPCSHMAIRHAPCFLFARKFAAGAAHVLEKLAPQALGF